MTLQSEMKETFREAEKVILEYGHGNLTSQERVALTAAFHEFMSGNFELDKFEIWQMWDALGLCKKRTRMLDRLYEALGMLSDIRESGLDFVPEFDPEQN